MSPSTEASPTPRQLRYLRALASATGTTFAYPTTRAQASRQIDRLRQLETEPRAPRPTASDMDAEQLVYATAVHPDEVSGFGCSATWRTASAAAGPFLAEVPVKGATELARYRVSDGERVLYGQLVNGCVRVTDRPGSGTGRSYLVEREFESDGHPALEALVEDYVEQSQQLDQVPMASGAVRQLLAEVGADA